MREGRKKERGGRGGGREKERGGGEKNKKRMREMKER